MYINVYPLYSICISSLYNVNSNYSFSLIKNINVIIFKVLLNLFVLHVYFLVSLYILIRHWQLLYCKQCCNKDNEIT